MKLQDQTFSISGTFNIQRILRNYSMSLLLSDGRTEFFSNIAEHEMHCIGAPTFTHGKYEVDEKGYGDEWYFKTPSGNIVAIGFRWETPRLRGDHNTSIDDVIDFIDYLKSRLK